MKKNLKIFLIIFIISFSFNFIPYSLKNIYAYDYDIDATTSVTVFIDYSDYLSNPRNSFWYETFVNGKAFKGYVYKKKKIYRKGKYQMMYKGILKNGPYVPQSYKKYR